MPGGLLQISGLSTESLFLNGAPEITFFKTVYRRHTNFAIESLVVNFEDPVEFNSVSTAKISQTGDLVHNVYLQVFLPEINLFRNTMPDPTDFQVAYNLAKENYNVVLQFMKVNRCAYVKAYDIFIAENNIQNATSDMINAIKLVFTNQEVIIKGMQDLLMINPNAPFTYNEISMQAIANSFDENNDKDELFKALSIGIDKSVKTQNYFYYKMYDAEVLLKDVLNKNIKFAWIKRIGHFIAEYIEVKIGGHTIDKHYSTWLNVWYELTANRSIEETYWKLIGNVPELTDFNRKIKPKYILKIPLQFWFCRFSGLALPLICLQYNNVSFNVKFRPIQEVAYIETGGNAIKYSLDDSGISLEEVPDIMQNVVLNANILADFYYLDAHERRRMASSSAEFLIEQVQYLEIPNITTPTCQVLLNSFVHPTKEIIWVASLTSTTLNTDGSHETQLGNYTTNATNINDVNVQSTVAFSSMDLNSYNRIMRLDSNYFNFVVPYERHKSTPTLGVNVYSFALNPEEQQPSGSLNMSLISRIVLYLEFQPSLFTPSLRDPLIITVFTRNINILRMIGGFGSLAYTYI
jgi:hypothetical protein